jgi:hypothetical protein
MDFDDDDKKIQFVVEFKVRCGKCKEYVGPDGIRGVYIKLHGQRGLVIDLTCTECGTEQTAKIDYHEDNGEAKAIEGANDIEEEVEVDTGPDTELGAITPQEIQQAGEELKTIDMESLLQSLEGD